jgi:Nuclease-related domain
VKQLRLRYGGTCVACGAALAKGAQAMHDAASKTVRCIACPEGAVAMPTPPIDPGKAGASAQKEHDRRVDKRTVRVKEKYGPRLGGFILRVTDDPQSTRAWAKGAHGERKLADALEGLPGVVALHDRRVPGTRGNIDHLLIAPAGIFVVDAKHYQGSLAIRDVGGWFHTDERLYVGGRDRSKLADNMGWQVTAVEAMLASVEVILSVTPVLCFIGVDWPWFRPPDSFRDVRLEDQNSLRKLITATPALDPYAVDKLARILATGFPAK